MQTLMLQADDEGIRRAAEIIQQGGLVGIPTETVYGLAGNALNGSVSRKIFAAKGRPSDNPLIVHIAAEEEARPLVKEFPEPARKLAAAYWPGPLTMVLPKSELVPMETSGGLSTVAVRLPAHPVANRLIRACGCPLAAPSGNLSGRPSPTTARHMLHDMDGRIDAILDGGPCSVGVESTIINLASDEPELLRYGAVTREMLEEALGRPVVNPKPSSPKVSGQLKSHYAPVTPVTLADEDAIPEIAASLAPETCAVLAPESILARCPANAVFRLQSAESEPEYAARLYANLHALDEAGTSHILIARPPKGSLWNAVNDRLSRASAPKPASGQH